MKIEPMRETSLNGTIFTVRKTAYCEAHSPPGAATVKRKGDSPRSLSEAGDEEGLKEGGGEEEEEEEVVEQEQEGQGQGVGGPLKGAPKKNKANLKQKIKKEPDEVGRDTPSTVPMVTVPQIPSYR